MRRWSAGWVVMGLLLAGASGAQVKPEAGKPATGKPPAPQPAAGKAPDGGAQPKPPPPFVPNPRLPKATQAAQLALHAEELQGDGFVEEAAKYLQQAAELTPDDTLLWDRAGWAHLDNGDAPRALKAFEAEAKVAPPGTPQSGGMLITQYALGHEKEVLALVRQLAPEQIGSATAAVKAGLTAKPRSPAWSFGLGYLYARVLGNSPRGVQHLEDVVQADPKNAEAWLLLVEMNRALDRGPQEDAAAVKYLELSPNTPDAFRLRAERLAALRKYPAASAEYEAEIAKHPLAEDLYFQLARLYERQGGARQAEATYRKLIAAAGRQKEDGTLLAARIQLANFQARQQNYVEAEKFFREAAAKSDATPATWTAWGSVLALSGRWDEAAKALEGAAARDEQARGKTAPEVRDDLLTARYHAAICRLAAGQKEQARAGLTAALATRGESRSSPEMEGLAFVAWCEGKDAKSNRLPFERSDERWASFPWRKEALEEGEFEVRGRYSPGAAAWRAILQQVQKRISGCWPADYALARIYAAGGFNESATSLLERVTRARADWWAPYFAQGQYFASLRQKDPGVTAFRKALELAPGCRAARSYLSLLRGLKEDEGDEN